MLLSILFSHALVSPPDRIKETKSLLLVLPEKPSPETALSPLPNVKPVLPDSIRRTSPLVDETEEDNSPPSETETEKETDSPYYLTEELEEQLRVEMESLERNAKFIREEKQKLSMKIQRQKLLANAYKYHVASEGAETGAVRAIDFTGWPKDVMDQVMNRYGITITRKFMAANQSLPFLNAAQVDGATYTYQSGPGKYEVFSLGKTAISELALLEAEAIVEKGFNPEKTRVIEIVFGIVKVENGYDLGVVKLVAEELH